MSTEIRLPATLIENLFCQTGNSHLNEEGGHSLRGVVIARNYVDHFDGIDQAWNTFNHSHLKKQVRKILKSA